MVLVEWDSRQYYDCVFSMCDDMGLEDENGEIPIPDGRTGKEPDYILVPEILEELEDHYGVVFEGTEEGFTVYELVKNSERYHCGKCEAEFEVNVIEEGEFSDAHGGVHTVYCPMCANEVE